MLWYDEHVSHNIFLFFPQQGKGFSEESICM